MGAGQGGANAQALQSLMASRGQQNRTEFRLAGDSEARRKAAAERAERREAREAERRAQRQAARAERTKPKKERTYRPGGVGRTVSVPSEGTSFGPGRSTRGDLR